MGYLFVVGECIACKGFITFNPNLVPSLRINGVREPLCEACARKWGEIHKTPVTIAPGAYEPAECA